MNTQQILGCLASGEIVVDRYRSHLHQDVLDLLPEALSRIRSEGRGFFKEVVHFDRVVGESTCVATREGDVILFAQRPKRWGLTRFVANRAPEPCSSVVVILKTADGMPGAYVLLTSFIGASAEPEPWDRAATAESLNFWANHALIWGSEIVDPLTTTMDCPW